MHHGLDSEMFDRSDFPYTNTFVREAIQNSLDARLDPSQPVVISFHFHSDKIGPRRAFLQQVMEYRRKAELEVPDDWAKNKARWLIVEDFNSSGLSGSLKSRTSDFWGYWLNFGITNKKGGGRGAHGIGRVTFLIASQIQSVIGYTRRKKDSKIAACGMAILRAKEIEGSYKSTHAYLAQEEFGDIFKLHESSEFHSQIQTAFSFKGYSGYYRSGLGIAILYPYKDLKAGGILAAAIENFAPAIINNDLVVEVNETILNTHSINKIAHDVESEYHDSAIRNDVTCFLKLVREADNPRKAPFVVKLPSPNRNELQRWGKDNPGVVKSLREKIDNSSAVLEIKFSLTYDGEAVDVGLRSVVGECPPGRSPIDLFFRRGMCLPHVKERGSKDLDIVTLINGETPLAKYLNFCEGKAHLDLLESKEVQQKLKDKGFSDGYSIRRLVKFLSADLRELLLPDVSEPNSRVFDQYFAKPKGEKKGGGSEPSRPMPNFDSTPEFEVTKLEDNSSYGVRIKAKPEFAGWPVNATITLAYANGSSRPTWSPYDFMLVNANIRSTGCERQISENIVSVTECSENAEIHIYGFDRNREVEVMIRMEEIENA